MIKVNDKSIVLLGKEDVQYPLVLVLPNSELARIYTNEDLVSVIEILQKAQTLINTPQGE